MNTEADGHALHWNAMAPLGVEAAERAGAFEGAWAQDEHEPPAWSA
jgi:hypothetical protein